MHVTQCLKKAVGRVSLQSWRGCDAISSRSGLLAPLSSRASSPQQLMLCIYLRRQLLDISHHPLTLTQPVTGRKQSSSLCIWASCPCDHLHLLSQCFSGAWCLWNKGCRWFWLGRLVVSAPSTHNCYLLENVLSQQHMLLKCLWGWRCCDSFIT